jgi:hypothetical protein
MVIVPGPASATGACSFTCWRRPCPALGHHPREERQQALQSGARGGLSRPLLRHPTAHPHAGSMAGGERKVVSEMQDFRQIFRRLLGRGPGQASRCSQPSPLCRKGSVGAVQVCVSSAGGQDRLRWSRWVAVVQCVGPSGWRQARGDRDRNPWLTDRTQTLRFSGYFLMRKHEPVLSLSTWFLGSHGGFGGAFTAHIHGRQQLVASGQGVDDPLPTNLQVASASKPMGTDKATLTLLEAQ